MARKKVWMLVPLKKIAYKVPEDIKKQVKEKANNLIQSVLKPKYIEPPPENEEFNYIVDICFKWYRSYFYFYTLTPYGIPTHLPRPLLGEELEC